MNRNIRIARRLVKIARMLVAGNWNVSRIDGLKTQWKWNLEVASGSALGPACVACLVFEHPGETDDDVEDDCDLIYKWFNESELKDSCRIDMGYDAALQSGGTGVQICIDADRLVPEPPINIVRSRLLGSGNLRRFA